MSMEVFSEINTFAQHLYFHLVQREKNVYLSAICASSLVSIICLSKKLDKNPIALTLNKEVSMSKNDLKLIEKSYENFLKLLAEPIQNGTLKVSTKYFVMPGYEFTEGTEIVLQQMGTIEQLNFANKFNAVNVINRWLQTNTEIDTRLVVRHDRLDERTCLVIADAICFKAYWLHKFMKNYSTDLMPFFIQENVSISMQMKFCQAPMKHKLFQSRNWNSDIVAQILEIPFTDPNLSMILILPDTRNTVNNKKKNTKNKKENKDYPFILKTFTNFEKSFNSVTLPEIINDLECCNVRLYLPQTRFEQEIHFTSSFNKDYLFEIFSRNRTRRLMRNRNLEEYESSFVQKILINISEDESNKDTPCSSTQKDEGKAPLKTVTFNVNHPFLFQIIFKHGGTAHILFFGRVLTPFIH